MNAAVRAMLARAGFYLVSGDRFIWTYAVVEVEPDGTCHQLTPTLRRGGVLGTDKWGDAVQVRGPFIDAAEAESAMRFEWYVWNGPA